MHVSCDVSTSMVVACAPYLSSRPAPPNQYTTCLLMVRTPNCALTMTSMGIFLLALISNPTSHFPARMHPKQPLIPFEDGPARPTCNVNLDELCMDVSPEETKNDDTTANATPVSPDVNMSPGDPSHKRSATSDATAVSAKQSRPAQRVRTKIADPQTKVSQRLALHGLSLNNVPGDGNCWFHAVSLDTSYNATLARDDTQKWLARNEWVKQYTQLHGATPEEWKKHTTELSKDGVYAESGSVITTAMLSTKPVRVVTASMMYEFIPEGAKENDTSMTFWLPGQHYQKLRSTTGAPTATKQMEAFVENITQKIYLRKPVVINSQRWRPTQDHLDSSNSKPHCHTEKQSGLDYLVLHAFQDK